MTWRFVGANFDQMHMNGNLRWVHEHPNAELVGVCDEDPSTSTGSIDRAVEAFDLNSAEVFDDLDTCLDTTNPDIVIGCPMNSRHPSFVERVAKYDVHVAIEKPIATTVDHANRMINAMAGTDNVLVINWPVLWDPERHTVKRLIDEGEIGDIYEVQYYGGNAGAPPTDSWFYDPDAGGGSLLDYLVYGVTFSTWYRDGELPETVTAETYLPPELAVDTQSAAICQYKSGISTLQSTWRMRTNPWEIKPQPMKGYEIVGTAGSISTRERGVPIRVQTDDEPTGFAVEYDALPERYTNLIYYMIDCLEREIEPTGPADPVFCRDAHRIIEAARRSADIGERVGVH